MSNSRYFIYATFKEKLGTRIKEKQISWITELSDNFTIDDVLLLMKYAIVVNYKSKFESIEDLVIENVSKL